MLPTLDRDHEVPNIDADISDANAGHLAVREGSIQSYKGNTGQFQTGTAKAVPKSTDKVVEKSVGTHISR